MSTNIRGQSLSNRRNGSQLLAGHVQRRGQADGSSVLNYVAGIIDPHGGLRVVSTKNKGDFFRHHRLPGERVFIVPGLRVPEPVPWDDIPWMMNCVVNHIAQWIAMQNDPDIIERGAIGAYRKRVAEGQQKSLHVTVT